MHKVDVTPKLRSVQGTYLKDENGEDKITVKWVCVTALMFNDPRSTETMDGQEHLNRLMLAMRIQKAKKTVNLDSDQISKIKKQLPQAFKHAPHIVGQMMELLEGRPNPIPSVEELESILAEEDEETEECASEKVVTIEGTVH